MLQEHKFILLHVSLISMRTSQGKIERCSVAELALLCSKAAQTFMTHIGAQHLVLEHVNIKVMLTFYPGLQYHG